MFRSALILCLCWLAGCGVSVVPDSRPEADLLGPGIYDVAEGRLIEPEALYERLGLARFVLVGESHDDVWHHEVQRRVYERLAGDGGTVALGMEMFQRDVQPVLDAYVASEIDEAAMLEQTEWEKRWGMDADFYRAIWRLAALHGNPVVALNIERGLVREVGRVGIDGLAEEERAKLPAMDLSNDAYRQHLREIFSQHGMGDDEVRLNQFFQAQVLWDEAMAASAFEFMSADSGVRSMVILVGSGHVTRGWGIPSRLERRMVEQGQAADLAAAAVVTVLPVTVHDIVGEEGADRAIYRDMAYLQRESLADYVWIGPE